MIGGVEDAGAGEAIGVIEMVGIGAVMREMGRKVVLLGNSLRSLEGALDVAVEEIVRLRQLNQEETAGDCWPFGLMRSV